MNFDEYLKIPALNHSTLVHALKSRKSLRRAIVEGIEPTPAMQFGTQYHELILEPEEFEKRFCLLSLSMWAGPFASSSTTTLSC